MSCCFCGNDAGEWGNNPWPYFSKDENAKCCDACNYSIVLPARLHRINESTADALLLLTRGESNV